MAPVDIQACTDQDADGIASNVDDCPDVSNATQVDTALEGSGDGATGRNDSSGSGFGLLGAQPQRAGALVGQSSSPVELELSLLAALRRRERRRSCRQAETFEDRTHGGEIRDGCDDRHATRESARPTTQWR